MTPLRNWTALSMPAAVACRSGKRVRRTILPLCTPPGQRHGIGVPVMAALEQAAWGFHVILRHGPREVDEQLALPGVFGKLQMEPPEALHVERGEPRRGKGKGGHTHASAEFGDFTFDHHASPKLARYSSSRRMAASTDSCTASMTFMRPCSPSKSWTGRLRVIFRSS